MEFISSIANAFTGLFTLIDEVHTSDEERMKMKNALTQTMNGLMAMLLGYEQKRLETRASIIEAEAKGEGMLQRNWRPIVMLTFTGLIVASYLGFQPEGMTAEMHKELFDIVELGLGGYVIGRSAEKVIKEGAKAVKKVYESKAE